MSFILMFFYWVVIPVAVILVARRLWINSKNALSKSLVVSISVIIFIGLWWWAVGEKWMLDRQVRELCAKDGGVKVYETVTVSTEKFNEYGQVNFYHSKHGGNTLESEYMLDRQLQYYHKGNPSLHRSSTLIVRKSDGKLLGESVFYKRGGGDLPGPWQGSSFMCPEPSVKNDVLRQIFITKVEE